MTDDNNAMMSVGQAYLDDVRAELIEIGADEELVRAAERASDDAVALGIIAAYVAERDAQLAKGRSWRWLVTGRGLPRRGMCFKSHARALACAVRHNASIKVGYGDDYRWTAITYRDCVTSASRALHQEAA